MKKKLLTALLCLFFALVVVCLFLSRSWLYSGTPRVQTEPFGHGSLHKKYSLSGTYQALDAEYVIVEASDDFTAVVQQVCVTPGQRVQAGDMLYRCAVSLELEQQLSSAKYALDAARLELLQEKRDEELLTAVERYIDAQDTAMRLPGDADAQQEAESAWEELAALAQRKRLFLFEAMTTQYQPNYAKLRELLPRVGTVRMVQCSFSQYSSRYDAFCAGQTPPVFDPLCAGGALMDLGVYNVSYIVGLFGEPNKAVYAANMERNIDTSGVLMMDYSGFKAVSLAAKDCAAPARCIIQGTKGYILQKSTPNYCGGVTFHPNEGKEEHYNLNGDRPRQAAEFEAFYRAMTAGDQELCARMLDTSIAVSRVLTVARRSAGVRFPGDRF